MVDLLGTYRVLNNNILEYITVRKIRLGLLLNGKNPFSEYKYCDKICVCVRACVLEGTLLASREPSIEHSSSETWDFAATFSNNRKGEAEVGGEPGGLSLWCAQRSEGQWSGAALTTFFSLFCPDSSSPRPTLAVSSHVQLVAFLPLSKVVTSAMGCDFWDISAALTKLTKTQKPRSSFLRFKTPRGFPSQPLTAVQDHLLGFLLTEAPEDWRANLPWLQAPGPGWGCPSGF